MLSYRDALQERVHARREAAVSGLAGVSQREADLFERQRVLSEEASATGRDTLRLRGEIPMLEAAIDRACHAASRVALARTFERSAVDSIRNEELATATHLQEVTRAQQDRVAAQCEASLGTVHSHRAEIAAMLAIHGSNEAIIHESTSVLPRLPSEAWTDFAFLTENETADAMSAVMVSPHRAPQTARTINPSVALNGTESQQLTETTARAGKLQADFSSLTAERTSKLAELKALERCLESEERKLRDETRRLELQAQDAAERSSSFVHQCEGLLLLCLEDQQNLMKLTGVPIPARAAATNRQASSRSLTASRSGSAQPTSQATISN